MFVEHEHKHLGQFGADAHDRSSAVGFAVVA
jgi:hypothetical protein